MQLEAMLENVGALRFTVATMKFHTIAGRFGLGSTPRAMFACPTVITTKPHDLFNLNTTDLGWPHENECGSCKRGE